MPKTNERSKPSKVRVIGQVTFGGNWIHVDVIPSEDIKISIRKDFEKYTCTCSDPRHQYPNRFHNFKCKTYAIAMEKIAKALIWEKTQNKLKK